MDDNSHTSQTAYRSIFPDIKTTVYPKDRHAAILARRAQLGGSLFFDDILALFGKIPDASKLYPPKSATGFRALYNAIIDNRWLDRLKKAAIFYYIRKDYDLAKPGLEYADKYARRELIPESFCSLMNGLHALDSFEFEDAMRHLTDPAVTPVEPGKVLATLLQHGGEKGPQYALAFADAAQFPMIDEDTIRDYFSALVQTSVESAFSYQRNAQVELRRELFEALVEYCISTGPKNNGMVLINLPLNTEEREWLVSYLKESQSPIADDTLLMVNIQQGNLSEALAMAQSARFQDEPEVGGMTWAKLTRGLEMGIGTMKARS